MIRYFSISLVLASFTTSGTLRAATEPHAGLAPQAAAVRTHGLRSIDQELDHPYGVWTNEDVERLSTVPGLISIVGPSATQAAKEDAALAPQPQTEDPSWYAEQAASLNVRLETQEARLRDFTLALDDIRDGKSAASGINVFQDNVGITPDATIDILQNRISQTQGELDALEDLARRNSIDPGILRGQEQAVSPDSAVGPTEQSQSDSSAGSSFGGGGSPGGGGRR